ncbi:MAG: hypothetical protein LUC43_00090 [Burkholderiales bacterium]|nr:hypothetical protein [Burkholderiales bacterium]
MKFFRFLILLALASFLSACNHPDLVKVGENYQKVMNQLGVPDSEITLPDGSIRVVYSKQPMSPHVYALIFSPDGTLIKKEQILYKDFFLRNIKPKVMDQADIDTMFGRPCEKRTFKLSGTHSYMYRYEEDGVPLALWVDFDNKTNKVVDWTVTIDPWSMKGGGGDAKK